MSQPQPQHAEIHGALQAHAARLKTILARQKTGKPLRAEDLAFLQLQTHADSGAGFQPASAAPRKSASIAAAVADLQRLGIDVTKEFLRDIKREAGKEAGFESSGRLHLDLLIPYIRARAARQTSGANQRPTKTDLECRRLDGICERIEFDNQVRAREYERTDKFVNWIHAMAGEFKPHAWQKLCNEYPADVAGMDTAQARAYGQKLYDELMSILAAHAAKWQKAEDQRRDAETQSKP